MKRRQIMDWQRMSRNDEVTSRKNIPPLLSSTKPPNHQGLAYWLPEYAQGEEGGGLLIGMGLLGHFLTYML